MQYEEALAVYERELAEYDRSVEAKAEWDLALKASHWRSLDGFAFEREMANLFREMDYRVATTPRTGDGGVDLVLMNGTEKTVVQCKAHNTKIPIGTLRELSAVRDDFGADRAILACFEGVTKPAADYIKDKPIEVLDVNDIVLLRRQRGLAVT